MQSGHKGIAKSASIGGQAGGDALRTGNAAPHGGEGENAAAQAQFLVIRGFFLQHIVGIAGSFKESLRSLVNGGGLLPPVDHGDLHFGGVVQLIQPLEGGGVLHQHGVNDAGDIAAVGVHVVRAARQGARRGCSSARRFPRPPQGPYGRIAPSAPWR